MWFNIFNKSKLGATVLEEMDVAEQAKDEILRSEVLHIVEDLISYFNPQIYTELVIDPHKVKWNSYLLAGPYRRADAYALTDKLYMPKGYFINLLKNYNLTSDTIMNLSNKTYFCKDFRYEIVFKLLGSLCNHLEKEDISLNDIYFYLYTSIEDVDFYSREEAYEYGQSFFKKYRCTSPPTNVLGFDNISISQYKKFLKKLYGEDIKLDTSYIDSFLSRTVYIDSFVDLQYIVNNIEEYAHSTVFFIAEDIKINVDDIKIPSFITIYDEGTWKVYGKKETAYGMPVIDDGKNLCCNCIYIKLQKSSPPMCTNQKIVTSSLIHGDKVYVSCEDVRSCKSYLKQQDGLCEGYLLKKQR